MCSHIITVFYYKHGIKNRLQVSYILRSQKLHVFASFVFLLSSRSESVPFKGFVQFSDGEFAELLLNLCLGILIVWTAENLKPLKIFNASKLIQWRNISIPSRVEQ